MTKSMLIVAYALAIAILAIVALKISGHGDLVEKASSTAIAKLGLDDAKKSAKASFAQEALGWDPTKINSEPVATVREGKVRLQKMIDELEKIRLRNKIDTIEANHKNEESQQEIKDLLDAIHAAQAHLKDSSAGYPAKINGSVYANRDQLKSAAANAIRRYNTLKSASILAANTVGAGEWQTVSIEEKLDIANRIMVLLDKRLSLAKLQQHGKDLESVSGELDDLAAKAKAIISEGEEESQKLRPGFATGRDRDEATVNSFKE